MNLQGDIPPELEDNLMWHNGRRCMTCPYCSLAWLNLPVVLYSEYVSVLTRWLTQHIVRNHLL
jgi:hypothetical protein